MLEGARSAWSVHVLPIKVAQLYARAPSHALLDTERLPSVS
jgi:hypothetical protein